MILTATRTGEVIGAKWDEINLDKRIWLIPKERTKTSTEHRVPLSKNSMDVLEIMTKRSSGAYVFGGIERGNSLSTWQCYN